MTKTLEICTVRIAELRIKPGRAPGPVNPHVEYHLQADGLVRIRTSNGHTIHVEVGAMLQAMRAIEAMWRVQPESTA